MSHLRYLCLLAYIVIPNTALSVFVFCLVKKACVHSDLRFSSDRIKYQNIFDV
jgi:hypothetical protein